MTEILFNANGQRLESMNEPLVVAKSRNEYTAAFTFSEDWNDISPKTATFRRFSDGRSFTVGLDSSGKCVIPWEVLETPRFYVSVYGGNLRTMIETYVNVEKTGYDANATPSGSVPQPAPIPTDLQITDGYLQLTANGKAVGNGVEIPKVTVDAELSDTSENPVQNKAVSAALHDIKQSVSSDCANALKKAVSVSGETTIEDVAPLSKLHIRGAQAGQTVTVRGKNLLKAIPDRVRKNIDITEDGIAVSASGRQTLLNAQELAALHLKPGATVTTSVDIIGENMSGTTGQIAIPSTVSGVPNITLRSPGGAHTFTLPADYNPANYSGLCLYGVCTYRNLQIEYGTKATEYEQGFADVTVTANADGKATVENAAYPTAVIETDGACTVEFDRDANRVIEKIEQAILSLGGEI